MFRILTRIVSLVAAFVATALTAVPSQAMPAFARQTGKACVSCHFQHMPALNEYGQEFKAGAYTDMGKQAQVTGKELTIPGIFNASLYTKIRYQLTNGTDGNDVHGEAVKTTHSGELQFPDEFALLIGGRVTQNIGFMIENQFAGGGTGVLAGFKLPFSYTLGKTMRWGVTPFLTDGLGASYGFELLSTGAVRNIRASEHRSETSALQYVFFNSTGPRNSGGETDDVTGSINRAAGGAASGLAFSVWNPQYYVVYTQYTPHHLVEAGSNVGGLNAGLLRAVWTPTFGDWALGIGVQSYIGGSMRFNDDGGAIQYVTTKGMGFDVQAHGSLGNMPLGVYLTHARAPGTPAANTGLTASDPVNLFNNNANTRRATALTAELGVIPNKATVLLSYRVANNGSTSASDGGKDNAWSIGGTYQLAQNVQFQLVHSTRSDRANGQGRYGPNLPAQGTKSGNSLTTFMLSAGF